MSAKDESAVTSGLAADTGPTTAAVGLRRLERAPFSPWRILSWSFRRELWHNRSIVFVPLVIGVLSLLGSLVAAFHASDLIQQLQTMESATQRRMLLGSPMLQAGTAIQTGMFLAALAYCLDALYSERRDRSILFWKSLPVSNAITVMSKAAIPMLVIPLVGFAISVLVVLAMALIGSVAFVANEGPMSMIWTDSGFVHVLGLLLFKLIAESLWQAPVYGWLLLVSGWAPRVPLVWAVIPPVALSILELNVFGTSYVSETIKSRLLNGFSEGLSYVTSASASDTPKLYDGIKFFLTPALWAGLLVLALFIAAAVWRRRRAEPA